MSAALVNLFHLRLFLPQNALVTPLAKAIINEVAREARPALRQATVVLDDWDHAALMTLRCQYRESGIWKPFFSIHFPVTSQPPASTLSRPSTIFLIWPSISWYSFVAGFSASRRSSSSARGPSSISTSRPSTGGRQMWA